MPESGNKLVKVWVRARTADFFHRGVEFSKTQDALIDLLVCLADKLHIGQTRIITFPLAPGTNRVEQMMMCILSRSFGLWILVL